MKTLIKRWLFILISLQIFQANAFQTNKAQDDPTNEDYPSKEKVIQDSIFDSENSLKEYSEAYYQVDQLNDVIGYPGDTFNLTTPQASLEHFIVSARNHDFESAAYSLNLNLLPDNISMKEAAILAEKLSFVLDQRVPISWDQISDRPDGQIDMATSTNKPIAGKPMRSVSFGKTDLQNRDISFRLQRIKYKDKGPIWLISSQTVENIEPLYQEYGPRKLDRIMPSWASFKILDIPIWKIVGTFLLIVLAYFISRFISYLVHRIFSNNKNKWLKHVAYKLSSPTGAAIGILIFYLLLNHLISFSGPLARGIYAVLLITVISIFSWLIMRVIDYIMDFLSEKKIGDLSGDENNHAKKMLTYVSVARRIIIFLVVIIAASIILSQFPSLEKLGISLMASAGIATVVVGIAAQSTLGNIIAGIQIAITKPVRIGDAVIIENSYGFVEDIRFTYLVVKTWDLRRRVIPLKSVISESFDNLSMTNSQSVLEIELHADYRVDVSKIREKFTDLVHNHDLWDGEKEPEVQVEAMNEKILKIRCLCSGKDYPTAWDLHCDVREQLMAYLSKLENGIYLSRQRVEIAENEQVSEKS